MRHLPLVATLTLLAALTACDGGGREGGDGATTSLGPGDEYVALGDSYTAAPRTGPMEGVDGCFRSKVNYPHLVAEDLGVDLVDNSCSGANSSHLTQRQKTLLGEHEPQLTGLDEETDLVTFRMGANDFGLFARIVRCARSRLGPGDSPCTDLDRSAGESSVAPRLRELEHNLLRALRLVQDRAPDAIVLAIGYPQVVPAEGTCDQLPLAPGDYDYARQINEGLNTALQAAADEAGVTYIDAFPRSEGHDICGEDPWIAGITPTRTDATRWHPFPEESRAVADLVLDELE